MKGVAASVVSTLLILISIVSIMVLYTFTNRLSATAVSKGETQLLDAKITPKLLALACLDDYGFLTVSSDDPLEGNVFYKVEYGLDEVASGVSYVDISDVGKILFNASMTENKDYSVTISSKYWKMKEYCTATLDPALVFYIPFSEGSGSFAQDMAMNGNDAYVNSSWVNGTVDYALRFDGLGQSARVNDTTGLDSEKFTLAFWGLREWIEANNEGLIYGGSFSVRSQLDGDIDFSLSGGSTVSIQDHNKTWEHFTMRYDGSTLSVFRNCTLEDSITSSYTPSGGDIYFGKGSSEYFGGSIDEVYFFARDLSDNEIISFCIPKFNIQDDAYEGEWTETDGYCPPEDPYDPDCIII